LFFPSFVVAKNSGSKKCDPNPERNAKKGEKGKGGKEGKRKTRKRKRETKEYILNDMT